MVIGGFCVVLSTCLAVLLGSPCRSVGPLSAQPQHGFAAPNTIADSLVHHAQTNLGPIPCPQVATLKIAIILLFAICCRLRDVLSGK